MNDKVKFKFLKDIPIKKNVKYLGLNYKSFV